MQIKLNKLVLILCAICTLFGCRDSGQEICYVDERKLMENYVGMKEAQQLFQKKAAQVDFRRDSLRNEIILLNESVSSLTEELGIAKVRLRKNTVLQKMEDLQQELVLEEKRMTIAVLDRLNYLISDFGKEMDLDMVISSQSGNSILYGKEQYDMTDELIDYVNAKY